MEITKLLLSREYLHIVQHFLKRGACVNSVDSYSHMKRTSVYVDYIRRYETSIKLGLTCEDDAEAQYTNVLGDRYITLEYGNNCKLLIDAIEKGNLKILEELLKNAKNKQEAVAKFLLSCGTDVNARNNPIFYGLKENCREMIEILLYDGADVNSSDEYGRKVLVEELLQGLFHKVPNIRLKEEIAKLHLSREANGNDITTHQTAIGKVYVKFIVALVEYNTDVNSRDKYGYPVLHIACEYNKPEIVEVLLKFGAGIDSEDKYGRTALHIAFTKNNIEIIKVLLKFGASIDSKDERGRPALHLACACSNADIVKALLKLGASIDSKDNDGSTALHIASGRSNLEIIEILLKFGIGIDSTDRDGRTALHIASERSNLEIVEVLLKHGAGIDSKERHGKTALHIASEKCNSEVVELLLTFGAAIDSRDEDGRTALHLASKHGYRKTAAEVLLKFGAGIDFKDDDGRTALHLASKDGYSETVEVLLKFGAGIDSKDRDGRTALHIASGRSNLEIVEVLLKFGAGIDSRDDDGRTALHLASRAGATFASCPREPTARGLPTPAPHFRFVSADRQSANMTPPRANRERSVRAGRTKMRRRPKHGYRKTAVEVLLKFGASIDFKDEDGRTALHLASKDGYPETVEVLLKSGADIDSRDKDGCTALHIASEKRNPKTVEVLLKFGADVDSKDNDDRTALHIACTHLAKRVAIALLDHGSDMTIISEGNYPESFAEIFKRHAVKVKTANLYVRDRNFLSISSDDEELSDFRYECEKEVATMKSEKIGNISLCDILTKGISELAIYAGNESIVQVFGSDDYKIKFPIYATMINSNFRKGERRKEVMEQGNKIFHSLFTNFLGIPHDCTEKVFNYLSNDDLRTIMDACNPVSVNSINTDNK